MFDFEVAAEIRADEPPGDEFSALVMVWAANDAWAEIRTIQPADTFLDSVIKAVVELRDALLERGKLGSSVFGSWGGCVVCLHPDDAVGLATLRETAEQHGDLTGWVDLVDPAAVFRFTARPSVSMN